ncbi:hypothetical protein [Cellvibrio sp. NN19]|uniref:hypothetical protein n=1 Tax=Cellvibrio chitinivorans TaxID=3102792 RepID=UPI002B400FDB|nr:hypothetical protein [Cellvibrio sp. NN19]
MKHLAIFLMVFSAALPVFAEEECVPAVDAADAMNVNQKECDYSNEGLNGYLHNAMNKSETGTAVATTTIAASGAAAATQAQSVNGAAQFGAVHELSVEVTKWSRVSDARAQLLPDAMEICPDGFAVKGEKYRPRAKNKILLVIEFSCLK